jgi:tetratricopeptide (TPR) repeat protein
MLKQYTLVRIAVIALTVGPLASCTFFDELAAVRGFKDANVAYSRGRYEEAIELYQKVIEVIDASGGESDIAKQLTAAYFYIGNSYDSLYLPGDTSPENVHNLDAAIRYYEIAADKSADRSLQVLSMQYLVAAFGPDKANAPSRSEPVLREMIQRDPENPDNYFRLAQLYEEAGLFEDAESVYQSVRSFRTDDPVVYLQLAGFYNRAGEFDMTIDALEQRATMEPDNPEAYYTISTFYWEKAFRDFRITQDEKLEYILAGLAAAERALALNDEYVEALVYKNILLRMQANEVDDLDERDALIAEADEVRSRAQELQESQAAASGPAA